MSPATDAGHSSNVTARPARPRRIAYSITITVVAVVAAWNSYWHIVSVAVRGHQDPLLAYSLPASVDGLMLVASLAIAEDKAHGRRPRGWARFGFWLGALVSVAANIASVVVHHGLDMLSIAVAAWPPVALLVVVEIMAKPGTVRVMSPIVAAPPQADAPLAPVLAAARAEEIAQVPPAVPDAGRPSVGGGDVQATDVVAVAALIGPALDAAADLAAKGQAVSRDALSERLRDAGYPISNARASTLLKLVRVSASANGDGEIESRYDVATDHDPTTS